MHVIDADQVSVPRPCSALVQFIASWIEVMRLLLHRSEFLSYNVPGKPLQLGQEGLGALPLLAHGECFQDNFARLKL